MYLITHFNLPCRQKWSDNIIHKSIVDQLLFHSILFKTKMLVTSVQESEITHEFIYIAINVCCLFPTDNTYRATSGTFRFEGEVLSYTQRAICKHHIFWLYQQHDSKSLRFISVNWLEERCSKKSCNDKELHKTDVLTYNCVSRTLPSLQCQWIQSRCHIAVKCLIPVRERK
jgi:hypothetical protein